MIICFINYHGQRPFPTAPKYSKDNVDIKINFFCHDSFRHPHILTFVNEGCAINAI